MSETQETTTFTVRDSASLLATARAVMEAVYELPLSEVQEGVLGANTDDGTLFVNSPGDLTLAVELRLGGRHAESLALLRYLNEQNGASAYLRFSLVDDRVWISGDVDGNPLVTAHLGRMLAYVFNAAETVRAELLQLEADPA